MLTTCCRYIPLNAADQNRPKAFAAERGDGTLHGRRVEILTRSDLFRSSFHCGRGINFVLMDIAIAASRLAGAHSTYRYKHKLKNE
jgi:hypothetical protein